MNCCSRHGDYDGLTCPVCELEERVAHLELARDNAMAMRDEARDRGRRVRESAGRRISGLLALVEELATDGNRDWACGRVRDILGADAEGSEKRVAR